MRPDSAPGLEPYRNQNWDASSFKSEPYDPNAPSAPRTARRIATNGFISKIPLVAIVLQMIAVSVSIATVGLLANAIAIYRSSKDWKIVMGSGVILPGWREPGDNFMVPIYSLLGSATTGAVLGAITLGSTIFIHIMQKHSLLNSHPLLIASSQFIIVALYIASLSFFRVQEDRLGMFGWSCAHRVMETKQDGNSIGLGNVCMSINTSWYLAIAAGAVSTLILALAVVVYVQNRGSKPKGAVMRRRASYAELKNKQVDDDIPMLARPYSR
ncbi:hypothetical protein VHEMI08077 [[Torrubiella] hemipterigena]|uniref:Uncharacterized protein n=1 Tax=[Torrubiella] hemipterigena TaxID=1531966 RepID=A0A0A1TMT2_9HYPO|nr:hypothetical protein VHEMI08077 [[Torrubiella] hemipterigena]